MAELENPNVIEDTLIRRAERYARRLVPAADAEDVVAEALLGWAQAVAAGREITRPWGFLRVLVRRRAADLLEQRRLWPRPWEQRRATMRVEGEILADPDVFADPRTTHVEEDYIKHCDGPIIERAVAQVATPPQRRSLDAWLTSDTPAAAARQTGVHVRTIHDQVQRVIRNTRRALGLDGPAVVLSFERRTRIDVPTYIVADILATPPTRGSGNALARKHGLSPQKISDIRKAHGIEVPKRKTRRVTECPHTNRAHSSFGMCGSCANRERRRRQDVAA